MEGWKNGEPAALPSNLEPERGNHVSNSIFNNHRPAHRSGGTFGLSADAR